MRRFMTLDLFFFLYLSWSICCFELHQTGKVVLVTLQNKHGGLQDHNIDQQNQDVHVTIVTHQDQGPIEKNSKKN